MSSMMRPSSTRTTSGSSNSSSNSYQQGPSPLSSRQSNRHVQVGGLPPPPNVTSNRPTNSTYAQNLARSMTIEEMRDLHRQALSEAEAKQTELRLVLASRYRELVGSSDEVTKMRERAQELQELVHALPELMGKLIMSAPEESQAAKDTDGNLASLGATEDGLRLRRELSKLPRLIHRALDNDDVHEAAENLLRLFRLIAGQTEEYPLATTLASGVEPQIGVKTDPAIQAQIRMTFLHVQSLPAKITRIATSILYGAASFGSTLDPNFGAYRSASALSSLDIFDIFQSRERPVQLLDLYFSCKAKLMQGLLNELTIALPDKTKGTSDGDATSAEEVLSKIVLILQYDVVLHPYQIFVLRDFPSTSASSSTAEGIMKSLPLFPASLVQSKVSNFLAAHLPLIRTKVKSVLVQIAGTTASALGKIRQSLYDKTDGVECMARLDNNGVCTWNEAVSGVVDVQSVLNSSTATGVSTAFVPSTQESASDIKFSLWSLLFSNTFSSLVHSLLTTSFQSVHSKVVSTLRLSLANAPPMESLLPHEAYRNTLHIASELDKALWKVSDDAHELLVHAEEREQSETRLRQSLYVQTCEIMGRLLCELRRMLLVSDESNAVRVLILGRLCHLLKFRLTALPKLLDPASSPAALHGSSGMISLLDLSSAFELADDNDDGLITFQEAMVAVDSAFSGTQFHGAEMVRETLLIPSTTDADRAGVVMSSGVRSVAPQDVTLDELTLLLARGLRHERNGQQSALGTVQASLDEIVRTSFDSWAEEVLKPCTKALSNSIGQFLEVASSCDEKEYCRMHGQGRGGSTSPYILSFFLTLSQTLSVSICPSDSIRPVPSDHYALSMGLLHGQIASSLEMIRWALLSQGLKSSVDTFSEFVGKSAGKSTCQLEDFCPSALVQLKSDLTFVGKCFFRRNKHGFGPAGSERNADAESTLRRVSKEVDVFVRRTCDKSILADIEQSHNHVSDVCDLFLSSLFGEEAGVSIQNTTFVSGDDAPHVISRPLYHEPVASNCRFPLLPIQSDRTLSGVQARGKYKEKEENESHRQGQAGGGAVRAGFGFLSSMLKKN